ncbi:hypothetical protein MPTK1_2g26520 [Marchantia polymorpha subsp. ruderalis]|uniref:Uncharacterized protein n=1 Tax=Marchantia polymorpha TaxID=3197 RepID=A0A2R6XB54_MARPO|nr:hypothetical protein MARPO_0025s0032 [Marchantia polymorpha]BBN03798.1 hypothetical protein Mp_2g26520 [Marchantia polymorpha subsp. ruderalis]|eukprot:PTQ43337.1 hypothetical protein MARPO_0025s0032 [Marchantia polymorpha]
MTLLHAGTTTESACGLWTARDGGDDKYRMRRRRAGAGGGGRQPSAVLWTIHYTQSFRTSSPGVQDPEPTRLARVRIAPRRNPSRDSGPERLWQFGATLKDQSSWTHTPTNKCGQSGFHPSIAHNKSTFFLPVSQSFIHSFLQRYSLLIRFLIKEPL